MRVTNHLLNYVGQNGITRANAKMLPILEQGNTGVWVNRPSDDPIAYALGRGYDKELQKNAQYKENNAVASGWLDVQSKSITGFKSIMDSIYTLVEQAATDTTSDAELDTIAFEMRQQLKQMLSVVNNNFNGNSIFGGTDFKTPAYKEGYAVDSTIPGIKFTGSSDKTIALSVPEGTAGAIPSGADIVFSVKNSDGTTTDVTLPAGASTLDLGNGNSLEFPAGTAIAGGESIAVRPAMYYQGSTNDNNDFSIEIMDGQQVVVNGVGSNIFGGRVESGSGADTPLTENTNAFEIIGKVISAVERHDREGIRELLAPMKDATSHIVNYQAKVGGIQNRVKLAGGMVEDATGVAKDSLSSLQDVDLLKLLEESKSIEVQYGLSVSLYSRIQKMNIMNYL